MKWNFRKLEDDIDHAAVSDVEYRPPLFGSDRDVIEVWLEGRQIPGKLEPVSGEVSTFVHTTVGKDRRMHHYLEWNGYRYEIFGTTLRKALDAIQGLKGEFYAFSLNDSGLMVYSWGKKWYLVAPLVEEVEE